MHIGKFATIPLQNTEGDVGILEFDLELDKHVIASSGDPKGYIMHHIALTLTQLCARHGTPKEIWDFSPSNRVRKLTGLPEAIPFR